MMLRLFENDQEEEKQSVGDGDDDTSAIDSSDLYSALNARKREFKRGIGKVRSYLPGLLSGAFLQSIDYLLTCICFLSITPPRTNRKRYQVCTQKGFLNVHSDPRSGPFATDNLKNKLEEGDIVTSVGEPFGTWIQHDSGGWSISKFEGFTYLKPVDEEDLD
jgi:hypothetical protein